ncbi:MAG: aminodeoxychorismate/anthranilate synthase component II [Nitrososphaeraceae archaeon]|nr:aminodeoxychorismate/anthranilate synthase component II [Nitrososphaeraceae archaeon]
MNNSQITLMKLLIIDNYDSFVYNIAQIVGNKNTSVYVYRNDRITIKEIEKLDPDAIIISPGPGNPQDKKYFGICDSIIRNLGKQTPILGICLGHQGISSAFGGKVIKGSRTRHGKTSLISFLPDPIFEGIKNPFRATRYHSLIAEKKSFPHCLKIIAHSMDDNEIMALTHKKYPIKGVQFHPESILTNEGIKILNNFLKFIKK